MPPRIPGLTLVLAVALGAVFVAQGEAEGGRSAAAVRWGLSHPWHEDKWGLVTASFTHANISHLAGNLALLLGAGAIAEQWLPRWGLLAGFLGTNAVANAVQVARVAEGTTGPSPAILGLAWLAIVVAVARRQEWMASLTAWLGHGAHIRGVGFWRAMTAVAGAGVLLVLTLHVGFVLAQDLQRLGGAEGASSGYITIGDDRTAAISHVAHLAGVAVGVAAGLASSLVHALRARLTSTVVGSRT